VADLMTGDPREIIAQLWPEHVKHLSPPGNKMGGGSIDPDEGVVCNCGQVLGFPRVQDEADYVHAEPEQPDTSGAQTGEPDTEPDWTPQQAERENYQDPDMLAHLESSGTPGPLARSVQDKADTIDALWSHPDIQAAVAAGNRDAEMRERYEANKYDSEARAYVHGQADLTAPDEAQLASRRPHAEHVHTPLSRFDPHEIPEQPAEPYDFRQAQSGRGRELNAYAVEPAEPKGVMPYRPDDVVPVEDPLVARVVTIDPSQPYGPQDVERQLLDIEGRLERGMHYQRYWEEREFAAESAYTAKSARARWESRNDGAKDIRDAAVQLACAEEWQELLLCRAMVRCMRETMHTLRSLQSGYQTVSRSVSDSMRQPASSRRNP
jgi:hypothetical protein